MGCHWSFGVRCVVWAVAQWGCVRGVGGMSGLRASLRWDYTSIGSVRSWVLTTIGGIETFRLGPLSKS